MDVFTEVYDKSRSLLSTPCFDKQWSNIEPKLKALFADGGFDANQAGVLELVRSTLFKADSAKTNQVDAMVANIMVACRKDAKGFEARAALVKLLRHLYFVEAKGAQSVWVVDHPSAYTTWVYHEYENKTEKEVRDRLPAEIEIFGAVQRKTMSDALQIARKWALDVVVKLGSANADTEAKVRRWFLADGADKAALTATIGTLTTGFNAIAQACNGNKVIFSDRPHKRANGGNATTFASVNKRDVMVVIYIFKLFLEEGKNAKGEAGKLWLCALTIIHELSHKVAGTKDKSYDTSGLKPGGLSLAAADAILNADSWGYFAADMSGAIPAEKFSKFYV